MKTLFRTSCACSRWAWFAKALLACAAAVCGLHVPHAAAEGGQACTTSSIEAETPWNVLANLTGIANGVSIADITFSQTVTATKTLQNYAMLATVRSLGATGPYQTIPLATLPGLGLRWRWAGYESISNAAVDLSTLPPIGTVVTGNQSNFLNTLFTTNEASKEFKHKWKFELVVIDARVYAGGWGDFTREVGLSGMQVMPSIRDNVAPIVNRSCWPVLSGFSQALGQGGAIALPELPKPPTPSCQFPVGAMNQTVVLNRGSAGSVPAVGTGRAEGALGETQFFISAVNCGLNSNYVFYFTDVSATASTKNYLNSSGELANKVSLRMYAADSSTPVEFGPPPVGGSMPSYAPGVTIHNTPEGSSFNHGFTVQYVRAPSYAGSMAAGSLSAQTTVTVVYP
ncbi:hypothetical protein DJFAAGMI_03844 [Comamonas sp. PE63]|uniref:Fimbrial-type adhesion domain-containing protein n=1 Tax=Comamonas brasiliensis TaxID=1812482 RepID=A0ABS5LX45_9BURK|nr:type 1 fimbrial protein [Comamonas sp. PE63]MBS3021080.1 hypothetical protein [Comamonas sp. PE63]